jgi:hypothetical protein
MIKEILPAILLSLLIFPSPATGSSDVVVHIDGQFVTVEATDAPLGRVLDVITQATGVKIVLLGPRSARVSVARFTGDLPSVLGRVAPGASQAQLFSEDRELLEGSWPRAIYLLPSSGRSRLEGEVIAPPSRSEMDMDQLLDVFHGHMLSSLGPVELAVLEDILRNSTLPEMRMEAVFVLASVPEQTGNGMDLLVQAMDDANKDVRSSAISALAGWGGDEVVQELSQALQDTDSEMRKQVMQAAAIMEPEAILKLAGKGLNDPEPTVRLAAVDALGQALHSDSAQIDDLFEKALRDADPRVRQAGEYYQASRESVRQDVSEIP